MLVQLGQGRSGLYGYDWLENLVGCDIHSTDRILPAFQTPLQVGDRVIRMARNAPCNPVALVEPQRARVLGHIKDATLGIITAEALYTNPYNARMEISDLGATETGVVLHPSSTIFNLTMLAAGAMILAGAFFAHRALHRRAVTIPTGLLGLGVLGVGIFPGNIHPSIRCLPSRPLWREAWRCCCQLG